MDVDGTAAKITTAKDGTVKILFFGTAGKQVCKAWYSNSAIAIAQLKKILAELGDTTSSTERKICSWSMADFTQRAQEMLDDDELTSLPTDEQLTDAMDFMEDKWDASIGASWDDVSAAIRECCPELVVAEEEDDDDADDFGDEEEEEDWSDDDEGDDHTELYGSDD